MEGLTRGTFTEGDLAQLRERGIPLEEAQRQLALLIEPSHHVVLDRPCRLGDGIETVSAERDAFVDAWAAAARAGRLSKFVPASGVASRMFRELLHFKARRDMPDRRRIAAEAAEGGAEAAALATFLEGLACFAFHDALMRMARSRGADPAALHAAEDIALVLDTFLSDEGLGCGMRPKGLLEFHRYGDTVRTPFEEQLVEAAELVRDGEGIARIHFTVSPEHMAGFEALLARVRPQYEGRFGVRFEVTFSTQKPSTDTLAVDLEGRPFRTADGLLFRPAGHGALIENLGELGADVVLIKNIDNVVPDRLKGPTYEWSRIVAGMLVDVQRRMREHLHAIESSSNPRETEAAVGFLEEVLDDELPPHARDGESRRQAAIALLDRPLRVCGMVPNTGEPGGGPFFALDRDGAPRQQIVESAQMNLDDPAQAVIFRGATHFNPVFMACGLRDHHDRPYELGRFIDPSAVIVTRKSAEGRALHALERPGLWNGAMAGWASIFVEVPLEVFNPVKTVLDLLRPEHQPEA